MHVYTPLTTDRHETPWGAAVNFDAAGSQTVRDFVFANARYWLNEFHIDGLRFDAVHEIHDFGPRHMLQDLAEQIRASTYGRHVHLVAENSNNQAGWLRRRDDGAPWLYDAQWSDDIHHGLHAAITGEKQWYYADFGGRIDLIGCALAKDLPGRASIWNMKSATRAKPADFCRPLPSCLTRRTMTRLETVLMASG